MILCEVNKNSLKVRTSELLTAGSREVNEVEFRFNSVWDGVTKTAVFRTEKKTVSVLLDGDKTQLPWEVLADAGEVVAVGVYGVSGETLVLPTVWGIIGKVVDATKLGDEEKEPTPDVYQQILDKLNSMSWDTLENKPFTSIGSGLKVEDGALTATAQGGADITITDTAEVGEVLTVEEVDSEGKPTKWKTEKPTAEQKQADWEQNDETAADYVKNRTHWKERVKTEIVPETNFTVSAGEWYYFDSVEAVPCVGDSCKVVYDNIEYSLRIIADPYQESRALAGNAAIRSSELEDSGEPFIVTFDYVDDDIKNELSQPSVKVSESGEHTIKVEANLTHFHRISQDYMPEDVTNLQIFRITASGNAEIVRNAYSLTTDSSGSVGTVAYNIENGEFEITRGILYSAGEIVVDAFSTSLPSVGASVEIQVTDTDTIKAFRGIGSNGQNGSLIIRLARGGSKNFYCILSQDRTGVVYYSGNMYGVSVTINSAKTSATISIKRLI